ncbi:MAG: beta-galactosidase [Patescibacteria group bacterium]|jgi:hypothetical protein
MYSLFKKILIAIGATIVAMVLFLAVLWLPSFNSPKEIEFGVSFSKSYADYLELDWKETYLAILDDLGVKSVRLQSDWDKTELSEGIFDFSVLDWQMAEAEKRGVKVLLAVGKRQPRWPECHIPSWLAETPEVEIQDRALEFIKTMVLRYKDSPVLTMWQVENEPLLNAFGECPPGDINFLKREIALVKYLDDRPILITDSGELSTWRKTAHLGDYFGTTIYRRVYSTYFGYFRHFFAPAFYRLKAKMVGLSPEKVIISELQAEPWMPDGKESRGSLEDQKSVMDDEFIKRQIEFAQETRFFKAYIWGVEWWYWAKTQGDESIWDIGKNIWQP